MVSRPSRWYREGPPHWWAIIEVKPHGWVVDYWRWDGYWKSRHGRFWFVRVASEEDGQQLVEAYGDVGLNKHPLAWEYKPNEIIDIASREVWQPTEKKVENET